MRARTVDVNELIKAPKCASTIARVKRRWQTSRVYCKPCCIAQKWRWKRKNGNLVVSSIGIAVRRKFSIANVRLNILMHDTSIELTCDSHRLCDLFTFVLVANVLGGRPIQELRVSGSKRIEDPMRLPCSTKH